MARIAVLEVQLAASQRALYLERAVRAFPTVEPIADLITASDEDGIRAQAARLAAHTTR